MKRYNNSGGSILLAVLLILLLSNPLSKAQAQPHVSVSFQTFYNELSPYGRWIDAPGQGYVWAPNAGSDFRPYYSGGHWVMTEYGNTWVSDYEWGWAPFHYGRWNYDSYYGWVWAPDTEWGPAWVTWRDGGGYYGWAPMAPGISINVSFGPRYTVANDWWVFIPHTYIYSPRFYDHYRGARYNTTIINRTTVINNTYVYNNNRYVCGPRRADVERRIGKRVTVYNLRDNDRPGRNNVRNNTVNIYRPRVEQRKDNIRPQQVVQRREPAGNNTRSNDRMATNNASRNDRTQQTQPDRTVRAEQRTANNNRDVRPQQVQERNEQVQRNAEVRQREMQQQNQQAEQQRQRDVQARQTNTQSRERSMQDRQQRQTDDAQRQRQIQQRTEQQQRIEQNRQQSWERKQETEQRQQRTNQRTERTSPQKAERPQQRTEQRDSPQRERRSR